MTTMEYIFLMALGTSSVKCVSAADDAISCHVSSHEEAASSAMNILAVCSEHLNTSVTSLGEGALTLSLDGGFFHHDIPLDMLQHSQFWVTYCRDWPQFDSCATSLLRNCTSSEVDTLRTIVNDHVLRAWRSIGLFPVPVVEKWACNGSGLSDRLRNVYDYGESKGCDVDSVKKCLKEWHQDLENSGFLEATDGSPFSNTDWLIK